MNEAADIVSGPNLLERYGCGPIQVSGHQDALYERHRRPKAVDLALQGKAAALMTGGRHMDELMRAVVARETGIGTARRISPWFVMDVAGHKGSPIFTDATENIAPASPTGRSRIQRADRAGDRVRRPGVGLPSRKWVPPVPSWRAR
jgi:phosphate acetyltransferase